MNKVIYNVLNEAGDILKKKYLQGQSAHEKQRWELVTEADIQVEQLIKARLGEAFNGDGFLGEECGQQIGDSGRVWIIDPIDGTTNFVMGKPYFAISLALELAGEIMEGYVYNPVSNELYYSTKRLGVSFLNGEVISVSQTANVADSLVAFGFSAKMTAIQRYYQDWQVLFDSCRKGVGWIAPALTLCNVARGRIDVFVDFGASIHGHAAASLILKNAGGAVFNYDMTEYSYQSTGIIGCASSMTDSLKGL
ncbi:MAG: inositol monophosphatase family protein [Planctomycetota bacterium]|jgi:fructose-1,6-bisphosphatase/inositol monophosphatase family enzyme